MAQEIYKMWMMKHTSEWYKLTKEEQDALMVKVGEALKSNGGENVVASVCLWASEEWLAWGVEKFPSLEAEQNHALALFNMGWYQYIEAKSYLGTEMK